MVLSYVLRRLDCGCLAFAFSYRCSSRDADSLVVQPLLSGVGVLAPASDRLTIWNFQ